MKYNSNQPPKPPKIAGYSESMLRGDEAKKRRNLEKLMNQRLGTAKTPRKKKPNTLLMKKPKAR